MARPYVRWQALPQPISSSGLTQVAPHACASCAQRPSRIASALEVDEYHLVRLAGPHRHVAAAAVGQHPQPALLQRLAARGAFQQLRGLTHARGQRRSATAAHRLQPALVPPARHGRSEAQVRPRAAKTHQRRLGARRARAVEQRNQQTFGEREPLARQHRTGAVEHESNAAHRLAAPSARNADARRAERAWRFAASVAGHAMRCLDPALCRALRRTRTFPPSKTAAQVSGGALPMAQRFFALSGITPLTWVVPVGSGGR